MEYEGALTGHEQIVKLGENTYAFTGLFHSGGKDFTTNAALIVTDNTAIFVDSGHSLASAWRMLELSSSLVRNDMRKILLLTHHHSDHVFGMSVFREQGFEVWGHRNMKTEIAEVLGEGYLRFFEQRFKLKWDELLSMHGKAVVDFPDHFIDDDTEWSIDGRSIEILYTPGHTPDSLSIYVPSDKVLIAGDTLYNWPRLTTHFGGPKEWRQWIAQLQRIQKKDISHIVPGHGDLSTRGLLQDNINKLKTVINTH
jgi:glyoxylase-like metal-dependent hydrolase (beta-lactamase superfamily II)